MKSQLNFRIFSILSLFSILISTVGMPTSAARAKMAVFRSAGVFTGDVENGGVDTRVTTQPVTNIGLTAASGNGNITSLGVPSATQYGVVWDTVADPTVALTTKTEQGVPTSTGVFTSDITGLTPATLYHVRAYATSDVVTVYGEDVTFTTLPLAPTVTTQAVTDIAATTASGNGNILSLGVPNPTLPLQITRRRKDRSARQVPLPAASPI
jgi:hypothetical protein